MAATFEYDSGLGRFFGELKLRALSAFDGDEPGDLRGRLGGDEGPESVLSCPRFLPGLVVDDAPATDVLGERLRVPGFPPGPGFP